MMSIDFNTLMQSVVISSFFLMNFIEMASFGSRVAGRVLKRVALGTTLQHSIFTASRIFLVIFLPALGYIVESGINLLDQSLKTKWPKKNCQISKKDKNLPSFKEFCKIYKFL